MRARKLNESARVREYPALLLIGTESARVVRQLASSKMAATAAVAYSRTPGQRDQSETVSRGQLRCTVGNRSEIRPLLSAVGHVLAMA